VPALGFGVALVLVLVDLVEVAFAGLAVSAPLLLALFMSVSPPEVPGVG